MRRPVLHRLPLRIAALLLLAPGLPAQDDVDGAADLVAELRALAELGNPYRNDLSVERLLVTLVDVAPIPLAAGGGRHAGHDH